MTYPKDPDKLVAELITDSLKNDLAWILQNAWRRYAELYGNPPLDNHLCRMQVLVELMKLDRFVYGIANHTLTLQSIENQNMTYRIRHLPTGMFFCPARLVNFNKGRVKSNLSKTGKVYFKKPTLKYIGDAYYTHLIIENDESGYGGWYLKPFVESEWTIEEL